MCSTGNPENIQRCLKYLYTLIKSNAFAKNAHSLRGSEFHFQISIRLHKSYSQGQSEIEFSGFSSDGSRECVGSSR